MMFRDMSIRRIFATNALKTIEIEARTGKGMARAAVPMGTSRGKHEASCPPVEACVREFSSIKKLIMGKDFGSQEEFDGFLKSYDGTDNFGKIGGNLSLALSASFLKASALEEGREVFEHVSDGKLRMPLPLANVIGAKGMRDIEEFLLLPDSQSSLFDSVEKLSSVYLALGRTLKAVDQKFNFGRDMESAWRVSIGSEKILDVLSDAVKGNGLSIGMDMASSELWEGDKYVYSGGKSLSTDGQIEFVKGLIRRYGLRYVEDPLREDDFEAFSRLLGGTKSTMICGDDLLTTNTERLKTAIKNRSVNAAIVKPNQIGTITDTMDFVREAKRNRITTVMSHRSGETEDVLISHLAVGLKCDYVKFGLAGERAAKLNELIRIEEKIF